MSNVERTSSLQRVMLEESDNNDFGGNTSNEDEHYVEEIDEETIDKDDDEYDDLDAKTRCQQQCALNARSQGKRAMCNRYCMYLCVDCD